jgi:hypothetical protein
MVLHIIPLVEGVASCRATWFPTRDLERETLEVG